MDLDHSDRIRKKNLGGNDRVLFEILLLMKKKRWIDTDYTFVLSD